MDAGRRLEILGGCFVGFWVGKHGKNDGDEI
jgi:hypothetical protein